MHLTVQHTRLFRTVYGSPQQCYVLCCIFIRIKHRIAVVTSKFLALSISYMETVRTSLACICGWHIYQFNAIKQTLVGKKTSKLIEVPFSYSASKFFSFLISRKSNAFQVLNCNSFTFGFCKLNNLFAYCVIDNCSRSSFFARQSFQDFFTAFRTFALKRTPYFLSFFSIIVKFFRIKRFTITKCRYFQQPHIHPDKFFYIFHFFFGNIDGLKQVKLTFLVNQIGFTFNVRKIVSVMAYKWYFDTTANSPKRNNIIRLVSHNSAVITNAPKWPKLSFYFLVKFVGICNFCYAPYQGLATQPKACFESVVRLMMKLEVVENALFPRHIRKSVTRRVGLSHSFKKQNSLLRGG